MQGQLDGVLTQAHSNEVAIDARRLSTTGVVVVAAATAGLAALLGKLLLGSLFTKMSKEEALEHPRRKAIFAYIQQHPGANFREVARNTDIAAGTVRHHLNVLERSGQIVEHNHGATVRLFENHGKFNQTWSDVVLLREPTLAQVHAWLKDHPRSPQKAVLEAMESLHGWSRSTTQHRLARLVKGGLATIKLQGRLKIYSAPDQPSPPQRAGSASAPAPSVGTF